MTVVDLKLIFVLVFILAMCYQTNVNCFGDDFIAFASHKYNVSQRELYEFVTSPELVDRWMNWLPFFMAADFKPLSIGKQFMIFSNEFEYLLRVTEHKDGTYLVLESDLLLRPRIELTFNELRDGDERSHLEMRLSFRRTSALFQYTIGTLYRNAIEPKLEESLRKLDGILNQMRRSTDVELDSNLGVDNWLCTGS